MTCKLGHQVQKDGEQEELKTARMESLDYPSTKTYRNRPVADEVGTVEEVMEARQRDGINSQRTRGCMDSRLITTRRFTRRNWIAVPKISKTEKQELHNSNAKSLKYVSILLIFSRRTELIVVPLSSGFFESRFKRSHGGRAWRTSRR